MSKEWPESADKMTISINRNSADRPEYIGWFNFGVLEGVMLLTPDLARLKGYYERQCKGGIKPSLIKFMTVADVLQKEDVPEEVKQRAQEEDQRLGASCLYFMWRGRETGEAQEFTEEIAETKGCLQFGDVTGAKFTGLGDFAFVGDDCEFTGVKVKDTIDIEPEPWNTFQI